MRVVVAKTHENLFDGEADSVTLPTAAGEVTILSHHEPLVSVLVPGIVTVRVGGSSQEFEVKDGVLEVSQNHATVLL